MDFFNLFAILTSLAAVFAWINQRTLKLPLTVAMMLFALVFSLGIMAVATINPSFGAAIERMIRAVQFDEALLHSMLGALLFAGALNVNLDDLNRQRTIVTVLATLGVVTATVLVGGAAWFVFGWFGLDVPFMYALLFGALIAPTDPVAALGALKRISVPDSLRAKIAGESLFNDGVALVVFLLLFGIVTGQADTNLGHVSHVFLVEVVGGIAFGFALGGLAYHMMKRVDSHEVEILITIAVVTGGYAFAQSLHTSGPLAIVVAGLMLGNHGRVFAMSDHTRERLTNFWELIDELLNAILFMLIGFEVLLITLLPGYLAAGAILIPVVLGVRFLSVGAPLALLRRVQPISPHAVKMLTWAGLRGGISVALALTLPAGLERDLILTVTFVIVAFSVLVQGLTIEGFAKRLYPG